MSRPIEAIATVQNCNYHGAGSWTGAQGFHADDPKTAVHCPWVGALGFRADPTPQTA